MKQGERISYTLAVRGSASKPLVVALSWTGTSNVFVALDTNLSCREFKVG